MPNDRFPDHNDNPDRDKGRFDGITYLFIRTHPYDNGSEPLASGLPFWVSPDITIVKPDGTEGSEAIAGEMNQMKVVVTNGGGIDAVDAYVEAFVADPSTAFTPATATPIGSGYLTVSGYSQAAISFPWSPAPADSGHRCLLARVSLTIPPDRFANAAIFDVPGDRHVAQKNISVVDSAVHGMKPFSFSFALVNPAPETSAFQVKAAQIRPADDRQLLMLKQSVGCGFAQFSDKPLRAVRLDLGEELPVRDRSDAIRMDLTNHSGRLDRFERIEGIVRIDRPLIGLLDNPIVPGRTGGAKKIRMKAGEVRQAVVTITPNPGARKGDLQVVEITQVNERDQVVGGLWIVVVC